MKRDVLLFTLALMATPASGAWHSDFRRRCEAALGAAYGRLRRIPENWLDKVLSADSADLRRKFNLLMIESYARRHRTLRPSARLVYAQELSLMRIKAVRPVIEREFPGWDSNPHFRLFYIYHQEIHLYPSARREAARRYPVGSLLVLENSLVAGFFPPEGDGETFGFIRY